MLPAEDQGEDPSIGSIGSISSIGRVARRDRGSMLPACCRQCPFPKKKYRAGRLQPNTVTHGPQRTTIPRYALPSRAPGLTLTSGGARFSIAFFITTSKYANRT